MVREFGIRATRYVNYHWAVIDETDIHFYLILLNSHRVLSRIHESHTSIRSCSPIWMAKEGKYLVRANASICKYFALVFNIVSAYPTHKRAINPHLTDSRENL